MQTNRFKKTLETLAHHLAIVFSYQQVQRERVARGQQVLTAPVVVAAPSPDASRLTRREEETLRYLAEGLTNRQIAARMCLVEKTIDKHVSTILKKLGAHTRTEAVAIARRTGLLSEQEHTPPKHL